MEDIQERFRATGRSTRLVDEYVQKFFTEPIGTPIKVLDHWNDARAHHGLMSKLIDRLTYEHKGVHFSVNNTNNTITRI